MILQVSDYNKAGQIISENYQSEWQEIEKSLSGMKLHMKASDQKDKQGSPIFDPVGSNEYIKNSLVKSDWAANVPIPHQFKPWGTDIDFTKSGIIVEVQFSNYPFLLNNLIRSELFFNSKTQFCGVDSTFLIIITKTGKFPSSNSTLYYEQAKKQLDSLGPYRVFDIPIRLVGMTIPANEVAEIIWTNYSAARYSREVAEQQTKRFLVETSSAKRSKYQFTEQ